MYTANSNAVQTTHDKAVEENFEAILSNIKHQMVNKDISFNQLSQLTGINSRSLQRFIRATRYSDIPIKVIIRIAIALDITVPINDKTLLSEVRYCDQD